MAMAKAPYLEMGVVVSFSEIFNRRATIEDARAILAQYNRESVLLVLAKLGAALRIWFRPDFEKDNGLARDVFKHAARAEAHSMPGRPRSLWWSIPFRSLGHRSFWCRQQADNSLAADSGL